MPTQPNTPATLQPVAPEDREQFLDKAMATIEERFVAHVADPEQRLLKRLMAHVYLSRVDECYEATSSGWLDVEFCLVFVPDGIECHDEGFDNVVVGAMFSDDLVEALTYEGGAFPAPAWAHAPEPEIPETVAELLAALEDSVELLDDGRLLVTRPCVVPPFYGAQAQHFVVSPGIAVHALGGTQGHNTFERW